MSRTRVRPAEVASRKLNRRLATRRKYELRFGLWTDQVELMDQWTKDNKTTVTNVMKKLVNYWLHMTEAKRQQILREY